MNDHYTIGLMDGHPSKPSTNHLLCLHILPNHRNQLSPYLYPMDRYLVRVYLKFFASLVFSVMLLSFDNLKVT